MGEDGNPQLRASDADRERVAAALREHCAVGRLTMAELDERLGQAYAARTFGELAAVTRDLPEIEPELPVPARDRSTTDHRLPAHPPPPPPSPVRADSGPVSLRQSVSGWLAMTIILNVIWVLTGITGDFSTYWPAWPMGIGAAVIGAQYVRGYHRRS
jgi:hypothetical protein